MGMINFTKMQGAGNDFILVNGFKEQLPYDLGAVAKKLCQRNFGIGGDGLIVCLPNKEYDFEMVIFNSDGSEAEMCGNGIRCAAIFAYNQGIVTKKELQVLTKAGIIGPIISEDLENVRVDMGFPRLKGGEIPCVLKGETILKQPIEVNEKDFLFSAVSMGNPHCVVFVDQPIATYPVTTIGPSFEVHPYFPAKTNVEFVEVIDTNYVKMRVWERGCGETLACGTGACATAVAAILTGRCKDRVKVELLGGNLEVEYQPGGKVFMSGEAKEVFYGKVEV